MDLTYLSKCKMLGLGVMLTRWLERGNARIGTPVSANRERVLALQPIASTVASRAVNISAPESDASRFAARPAKLVAPAVFDQAMFQKSLPAGMGMDTPLARRIMQLFVGESAKLLAEIEHAAVAADTEALFLAAQSLKSSAASVGAAALSSIAKTLEAQARARQTGALADHPALLRLAHARFCDEPAICKMVEPEAPEKNAA